MHHHKTYMYANFQSKPWAQNYLKKIDSFINLQLLLVNSKKSIISDMRHRKTYMYVNFQQNRVCRLVKPVRTNIFAKNCKLHTFAIINSNFVKINFFRHASSYNVHVNQFSGKSG